jgi:DNA-binding NarL/FixJ family response regulator
MNSQRTRILLADDNPALRSALRLLLKTRLKAEVVGEAPNMEDLLSCLPRLQPDIVILDWELPGLPSAGRVAALRQAYTPLKVLVTSSRPEVAQLAKEAYADAFVSKSEPPEQLVQILQELEPGRIDILQR